MPTNLELLPPEERPDKGQPQVLNQTTNIGQFIQLVNQNAPLPDGAQLATYIPEDKEWVKKRMEIEQEHRHKIFEQLAKNQHELNTTNAQKNHESTIFRFTGGVAIILASIFVTGLLLYLKLGWLSLGPLALTMSAPLSASMGSYISQRIKSLSALSTKDTVSEPPET